jgi:hypothetical protein
MAAEFNLDDCINTLMEEIYRVINHEHEDIYLTEEMFDAFDVYDVVQREIDHYVMYLSSQGKRHLIMWYGLEGALQIMIDNYGPLTVAPTVEALCYNIIREHINPSYVGFIKSMEDTGVETYNNECENGSG